MELNVLNGSSNISPWNDIELIPTTTYLIIQLFKHDNPSILVYTAAAILWAAVKVTAPGAIEMAGNMVAARKVTIIYIILCDILWRVDDYTTR